MGAFSDKLLPGLREVRAALTPAQPRDISFCDVLQALSTQGRVLNALILRETKTRYGKHKIGFVWVFLEPVLTVLVFVLFFYFLRSDAPHGMPLAAYLLVGFCGFAMFRSPWPQMQNGIAQSRPLLSFPQVTTFDVFLARGLLEGAVSFFVLVVLLFVAWLLGFEVRVERPLGVLLVCLILFTLSLGLGFLLGTLGALIPSLKQVTSILFGRPLFLSSGLFFTVDTLPREVIPWLMLNPILHCIELLRGEFFHEFETAYGSWTYAGLFALILLALGLLVHQALSKRAVINR